MSTRISDNFTEEEFRCKHCLKNGVKPDFLEAFQLFRDLVGKPFIVHSGYRCKDHPVEKTKAGPGRHAEGIAADFHVENLDLKAVFDLILAKMPVFKGIGVAIHQNYLHVDTRKSSKTVFWAYDRSGKDVPWNGKWSDLPK